MTPTELVEKHKTEMKALMTFMEAPTPSDCSDDDERVYPGKKCTRSQQNVDSDHQAVQLPQQPPRLSAPSPSNLENISNSEPSYINLYYRRQKKLDQRPSVGRSDDLMIHRRRAARIQWKNRRLDDAEENAEHKKSRVDLVETDSPRRSVACVKALVELSMRLEFMI
ncbi:hypothetical protein B7494_g3717 [Chlorociboria aeruginascens]|nr:hypothetical protein B7494_g3717 [Chlorociboria aeruginascens]